MKSDGLWYQAKRKILRRKSVWTAVRFAQNGIRRFPFGRNKLNGNRCFISHSSRKSNVSKENGIIRREGSNGSGLCIICIYTMCALKRLVYYMYYTMCALNAQMGTCVLYVYMVCAWCLYGHMCIMHAWCDVLSMPRWVICVVHLLWKPKKHCMHVIEYKRCILGMMCVH